MSLNLDYFYTNNTVQFRFLRVPKALLRDGLSLNAAALYGLMLDRVALSARNGWTDPLGRVFIYFTQADVQTQLRCGHNRATALMRELERYGLIERKRQGLCKPAKIYVKNLSTPASPAPESESSPQIADSLKPELPVQIPDSPKHEPLVQIPDSPKHELPIQIPDGPKPELPVQIPVNLDHETPAQIPDSPEHESSVQTTSAANHPEPESLAQTTSASIGLELVPSVRYPEDHPAAQSKTASHAVFFSTSRQAVQTASSGRSGAPEAGSPDRPKRAAKDTEKKETDFRETNLIHPQPPQAARSRRRGTQMDEMRWVEKTIRENIDYEGLVRDHPGDTALFDGYAALLTEACCSTRETVRVCGQEVPTAAVRKRFLSLDREHILYVRDCLCGTTAAIANIKAYTLSALYNAPATMDQYYTALAGQHERP